MPPARQRSSEPALVLGEIARSIKAVRWLKQHHKIVWLDLADLAAQQGKTLPACVTTDAAAIADHVGEVNPDKIQRWLRELAEDGVVVKQSYDGRRKVTEYRVSHPDEFTDSGAVVVRPDDQGELFDRNAIDPEEEETPKSEPPPDTLRMESPSELNSKMKGTRPETPRVVARTRRVLGKLMKSPSNLDPKMKGTPDLPECPSNLTPKMKGTPAKAASGTPPVRTRTRDTKNTKNKISSLPNSQEIQAQTQAPKAQRSTVAQEGQPIEAGEVSRVRGAIGQAMALIEGLGDPIQRHRRLVELICDHVPELRQKSLYEGEMRDAMHLANKAAALVVAGMPRAELERVLVDVRMMRLAGNLDNPGAFFNRKVTDLAERFPNGRYRQRE